jgi:hypothetical protein
MAIKNERKIPESPRAATSVSLPTNFRQPVIAHSTPRRLIMDGPLLLTRVVRKVTIPFELIDGQGDTATIQVECLSPEQTPRSLLGILCNDLLVLCRDASDGKDPISTVDLWAVLRMQTLPQPASIVHGNGMASFQLSPHISTTFLAQCCALLITRQFCILRPLQHQSH